MNFRDFWDRIPARFWIIALLIAGAITVGLVTALQNGRFSAIQPVPVTGRWDEQAQITIVPLASPTGSSAGGAGEPVSAATSSGTVLPAARPGTTPPPGSFVAATCTYAETYWLEHPESWPTENIIIGPHTYNKREMLDALAAPESRSAGSMLKQLLVTLLNATRGVDTRAVDSVIEQAAMWLSRNLDKAFLTAAEDEEANRLAAALLAFNQGQSGPTACPGQKLIVAFPSVSSPTPGPSQTATASAGQGVRRSTLTPTTARDERGRPLPAQTATRTPFTTQTQIPSLTPLPGIPASSPTTTSTGMPTSTPPFPTIAPGPTGTSPVASPVLPSSTPQPSSTPATRPTATATPRPPAQPSNTPKPSNTPRPSNTPKPTHTPQPTATQTPVPPAPTDTQPAPTNTSPPPPTDTQPVPTATSPPPPTDTQPAPTATSPPPPTPTQAPPPIPTNTPQPVDTQQPTSQPPLPILPTLSFPPLETLIPIPTLP